MDNQYLLESEEHPDGYLGLDDNILDGITMQQLIDAVRQEKHITPRTVSAVLFDMMDTRLQDLLNIVKDNCETIVAKSKHDTVKIDEFTEHFEVDGFSGTWSVVDSTWYRDRKFYLMKPDSPNYNPESDPCIAVDEHGIVVADDLYYGLDDDFEDAACEYIDGASFEKFNLLWNDTEMW